VQELAVMAVQEITCATCNVALQGPADPKPEDRFECPGCGIGDSFDRIMSEIGDYVTEQAADSLRRSFQAALSNSSNMTFRQSARRRKTYRFVVDLNL
jgi:hypothetical protein